jgi:molybdopterin biosynthesis enzyme
MDGYAVRAADTGAGALPVVLDIVAEAQVPASLDVGTASSITTQPPSRTARMSLWCWS